MKYQTASPMCGLRVARHSSTELTNIVPVFTNVACGRDVSRLPVILPSSINSWTRLRQQFHTLGLILDSGLTQRLPGVSLNVVIAAQSVYSSLQA